jgi:acyl-CoA thioester hydrolase
MGELSLRINPTDLFVFETRLPVMTAHVREGNCLTEESLLSLLQEARLQYLAREGMSEKSLVGSVGFFVSRAHINYHALAFHGDELRIQIYARRFRQGSRLFSFNYPISRVSDGKVIADVATEHAFYDFETRRVTSTPTAFYWVIHRNLQLIDLAA